MSEVADACQIILICGKMVAAAGGLSLKAAMLMMKVYNSIYLGKWKGSTSFKRFRDIKGEDYEFINICTEDTEKLTLIEKEMGEHSLLFARLPDLCGGDGNTQYVIAKSDLRIFEAFLMDHTHGALREIKVGPITESDYARTAVHPETGEYTQEFQDLNASARAQYHESRLLLTMTAGGENTRSPFHKREPGDFASDEPGEVTIDEDPPDKIMITHYGQREEIKASDLMGDPQIRLRNEIFSQGEKLHLIYDDPVKTGERWAVFPVHDGDHIIIIPKSDMLSGNTTRERQVRGAPIEKPPRAMLYTSKNYVIMDIRSQEKHIIDGSSAIELMKGLPVSEKKERLSNLERNIEKNVGSGARVPVSSRKRSGR